MRIYNTEGVLIVEDETIDNIKDMVEKYRGKLRNANLENADLGGADLRGANLQEAYLYRAKLILADLRGVNLFGANLFRANLEGATYNDKTVFPYGFDPEEHKMIKVDE